MPGRSIDRHFDDLDHRLSVRLVDHPTADGNDQSGHFESRNELVGLEEALGRMVPAQEGFDTDDRHVRKVEDRLIAEVELIGTDGGLEVQFELVPTVHGRVHLRLEDHVAVLARFLRPVQRDVGVTEQLLARVPRADGDTDRRRDGDRVQRRVGPSQLEGLSQDPQEPFGHELGTGRERHALGQHHELVAPQPGDGVRLAQRAGEACGDGAEQIVPDLVSQVVVHVLEAVQIDEEQCHVHVVPAGPGHRLLYPVQNEDPVGQPRQAVMQRLVTDLLQEAGVVDGDRRLPGQAAESLGDLYVVVEPLGMHRDVDGDPAEQLVVQRDAQGAGGQGTRSDEGGTETPGGSVDGVTVQPGIGTPGVRGCGDRTQCGGRSEIEPVRGIGPRGLAGRQGERHNRPVAVDDRGDDRRQVLRHLVARRKAPERAGEGKQGLRRLGLAAGLDNGGFGIKGRSGETGIGFQHGTLARFERIELGAYGNQVPVVAPLRGDLGHEDVFPRFGRRLPKGPGHCGAFGLVETLGPYETAGGGARLDVENELGCLDRPGGPGHDPGEHVRQSITRSQFRHRTLQFRQSGLQKADLHFGALRRGFAPLRRVPAKAGGATGIAVGLARLVADIGYREAEELGQRGGHAQPERAELPERLVRRPHPHLHAALIGPPQLG